MHFEIGLFAGGLFGVFDEGVLETVPGALVADYFAGEDFPEAAEYQLQVFVWVELVFMSWVWDLGSAKYLLLPG